MHVGGASDDELSYDCAAICVGESEHGDDDEDEHADDDYDDDEENDEVCRVS